MSDEPEHDPAEKESGKTMGFWDHIGELRLTIIKCAIAFAICAGLVGYYVSEFQQLITSPFDKVVAQFVADDPELKIELGTNTPAEGFNLILDSCLYGGMILAAPFILFFIAQFVAPALTKKETKAVLPMCVAACGLFISGAAFGFFVLLPAAMQVFIGINLKMHYAFRWSAGSYYSNFMQAVFGTGAAFEFPLLIVMLVWIGIVSTTTLRKHRRHAMVAIAIIAAIVTPTTDLANLALCAAPLCALYEAAIWVSLRVEKRRDRSGAAALIALLALLPRGRTEGTPRLFRA